MLNCSSANMTGLKNILLSVNLSRHWYLNRTRLLVCLQHILLLSVLFASLYYPTLNNQSYCSWRKNLTWLFVIFFSAFNIFFSLSDTGKKVLKILSSFPVFAKQPNIETISLGHLERSSKELSPHSLINSSRHCFTFLLNWWLWSLYSSKIFTFTLHCTIIFAFNHTKFWNLSS